MTKERYAQSLLEQMQQQFAEKCAETKQRFLEQHGDVQTIERVWWDGHTLRYEVRSAHEALRRDDTPND